RVADVELQDPMPFGLEPRGLCGHRAADLVQDVLELRGLIERLQGHCTTVGAPTPPIARGWPAAAHSCGSCSSPPAARVVAAATAMARPSGAAHPPSWSRVMTDAVREASTLSPAPMVSTMGAASSGTSAVV